MATIDEARSAPLRRRSRCVTIPNGFRRSESPFTNPEPFTAPLPFTRPFVRPRVPLTKPFVRPRVPFTRPLVRPRVPFTRPFVAPRIPFPRPGRGGCVRPAPRPFVSPRRSGRAPTASALLRGLRPYDSTAEADPHRDEPAREDDAADER